MRKLFLGLGLALFALPLFGDEIKFDFSLMPTNQTPSNCVSLVSGEGKIGAWKVITDEMPLPLAPLTPGGASTAPKAVVAQLAWDSTDEHFPMLQLSTNTFGDFTFKTRFKIHDGLAEQMAGVAFRMQDEKNYYYVRASALGNTFYFYRVYKGQRSEPSGNQMHFEKDTWYELTVECTGPKIHIMLNGQDALPILSDPTFSAGKIALWTKSDSISYFTDTSITYKPIIPFVKILVRDTLTENPKLLGLEVTRIFPGEKEARIVAASDESKIGQPGEKTDADCIARGLNYYRKDKTAVYVTMPLRDRNGDAVAAARFKMKRDTIQTEENALTRAMPLVKAMQERVSAVDSLY